MEEETTRKPGIRLFRTEPLRRLCIADAFSAAALVPSLQPSRAPQNPLFLCRGCLGSPPLSTFPFLLPPPLSSSAVKTVSPHPHSAHVWSDTWGLSCAAAEGGGSYVVLGSWSCSWFLPDNIIILIFKQGTWYKTGLWYNGIMHSDSMVPIVVPWHQLVVGQTEGPWYNGIVPRQK